MIHFSKFSILIVCLVFAIVLPFVDSYAEKFDEIDSSELNKKLSQLSIPWVEHKGSSDQMGVFSATTFAGTAYTKDNGIAYDIIRGERPTVRIERNRKPKAVSVHTVFEQFLGTKSIKVEGEDPQITRVNYFIGVKENWRTGERTFGKINLGEVWEGIGLSIKASGGNLEKIFQIKGGTGKNVDAIKIQLVGVDRIGVSSTGELDIEFGKDKISFTKPRAWQVIGGQSVNVDVSYIVNETIYGFKLGSYDTSKDLWIDPLLKIAASTFIPGNAIDFPMALKVDKENNNEVYIAGYTTSTNFPGPNGPGSNAYQQRKKGQFDAFVSKLDTKLTVMGSSTYLGGGADDLGSALYIGYEDTIGVNGLPARKPFVYVAGSTESDDFPTQTGSYDTTWNGGKSDAFISKLSADLGNLEASTYLGGSDEEMAKAIVIYPTDAANSADAGRILVTGYTRSDNFRTTFGAYRRVKTRGEIEDKEEPGDEENGTYLKVQNSEIFVSKLSKNLNTLEASTFLGGNNHDEANSIAIAKFDDGSGGGVADHIYITGYSGSFETLPKNTYPTTAEAYSKKAKSLDINVQGRLYHTIPNEIVISRLNSKLTQLEKSTFLGSSGNDVAYSIVADEKSDVNVYIAGSSAPLGNDIKRNDYPTTKGAYSNKSLGVYMDVANEDNEELSHKEYKVFGDVVVSRLDKDLKKLVASTFIGGAGIDFATVSLLGHGNSLHILGISTSYYDPDYGKTYPYPPYKPKSNTNYPYPTTTGKHIQHNLAMKKGKYKMAMPDMVVSILNARLTTLLGSTYLGGAGAPEPFSRLYINGIDTGYGLDLNSIGDIYLDGGSGSKDYPVTANVYSVAPDSSISHDLPDVVVSKLQGIHPPSDRAVFAEWNGKYGVKNIMEHINLKSDKDIKLLENHLYSSIGDIEGYADSEIKRNRQTDLDVNSMSDFVKAKNKHGLVSSDSMECTPGACTKDDFDGRMVYYKPDPNRTDEYQFAFAMPFDRGANGDLFVTYDTTDISGSGKKVDNRVRVINLNDKEQVGNLYYYYYDNRGNLITNTESITINPLSLEDLSVNAKVGDGKIGMIKWVPNDQNAKFRIRNLRYLYTTNSVNNENFYAATQLLGSKGVAQSITMPVDEGSSAGDRYVNSIENAVLELSNASESNTTVTIKVYNAGGVQVLCNRLYENHDYCHPADCDCNDQVCVSWSNHASPQCLAYEYTCEDAVCPQSPYYPRPLIKELVLTKYQTRHIKIKDLTEDINGQRGVVEVSATVSGLIANVLQYKQYSGNKVDTFYAIQGEPTIGANLRGTYNTFFNQECRLLITNSSGSTADATITMTRTTVNGTSSDGVYPAQTVPAKGLLDLDLCSHVLDVNNDGIKDEAFGIVAMTANPPNALSATVLRIGDTSKDPNTHTADGEQYRFVTPLREKIP